MEQRSLFKGVPPHARYIFPDPGGTSDGYRIIRASVLHRESNPWRTLEGREGIRCPTLLKMSRVTEDVYLIRIPGRPISPLRIHLQTIARVNGTANPPLPLVLIPCQWDAGAESLVRMHPSDEDAFVGLLTVLMLEGGTCFPEFR